MGYFTERSWLDRVVQFFGRRRITIESQSATEIVGTLTREEGTVTTEGTPLSAANLNDLENRINTAFTAAENDIDGLTMATTETADKLDVLWKLSKGIIYDWQKSEVDGVVTVPSGAKSSVLQGLKGKSILEDGELKSATVTKFTINGKNLFDRTNYEYVTSWSGNVNAYIFKFELNPYTQYTLSSNVPTPLAATTLYFNGATTATNGVWVNTPRTISSDAQGNIYVAIADEREYTQALLDGTYWVQLEVGTEATEYVPHEPTDYPITFSGKSAGTVRDEIDLVNKKYIQRIGVVDLGTLAWSNTEHSGYSIFRTTGITDAKRHAVGAANEHQINSNGYTSVTTVSTNMADMSIIVNSQATTTNRVYIRDNRYATPEEFKTAMDGVLLFYELATPIETDITDEEITAITASGDTIVFDGDVEVGSVFNHFIALNEVNL